MAWDHPPPQWPFALNKDKAQEDGLIGLWTCLGPSPHNYVYDLVGRRNFAFAATPPIWETTGERDWPIAPDFGTNVQARKMAVPHEAYWDLTERVSLCAWFMSPQTTQHWSNLIGKPNGATHVSPFWDYGIGTTGNIQRGIWFRGNDVINGSDSAADQFEVDVPNLAVGRWDQGIEAGSMDIFMNGEEVAYTNNRASAGTTTASTQDLCAGTNVEAGDMLNGKIFEQRIYDRRLEDIEIARMHDPATRWDDYVELGRKVYFVVPAAPAAAAPAAAILGL